MLVNISHETYSFPSDSQKATKKRKVQERAKTYMQGLSACSASPNLYPYYFGTALPVLVSHDKEVSLSLICTGIGTVSYIPFATPLRRVPCKIFIGNISRLRDILPINRQA